MIWKKNATTQSLNELPQNMTHHLGIEFTEVGPDYLKATMPVDTRTSQPFGVLHGGASCVLAETMGSVAANLCIEGNKRAVGIEINASHLRPALSGLVTGHCTAIRIGRSLQVWQTDIFSEDNYKIATSRLTVAIIEH